MLAQHALQGGHSRARWTGCSTRLAQLLRIAEQDQVRSCMRGREDVGERHLAGLVNQEDIDAVAEVLTSPKPSCPTDYLGVSRVDRVQYLRRLLIGRGVGTCEDTFRVRLLRDQ